MTKRLIHWLLAVITSGFFMVQPVPEPRSWMLLASGALALLALRRGSRP